MGRRSRHERIDSLHWRRCGFRRRAALRRGHCSFGAVRGFDVSDQQSLHGSSGLEHGFGQQPTVRTDNARADIIGLVGAGGAIMELKAAKTVLSAKGFTFTTAIKSELNSTARRKLTKALGIGGLTRAPTVVINKFVRQRLLDGVGGAIGLAGSGIGGVVGEAKDMVIWVVADDFGS